MNSKSLKFKMLAQTFVFSVVLCVAVVASVITLNYMDHQVHTLSEERLPISLGISQMKAEINGVFRFAWLAYIRSNDLKLRSDSLAMTEKSLVLFEEAFKKVESQNLAEKNRVLFNDEIKAHTLDLKNEINKGIVLLQKNDAASDSEAKAVIGKAGLNFGIPMTKILTQMLENAESYNKQTISNIYERTITIRQSLIVGSALLMLLFFVYGYWMTNKLSSELQKISQSILSASQKMNSGSYELSSASTELSSSAVETASSLEETVASAEEITSTVKINTEHSMKALQVSKDSSGLSQVGYQETLNLKQSYEQLAISSKKIEAMTSLIEDISFQTNLLALNAAVEAARAGEQGKGFAVVADAVRSLAQRSSEAAKEISVVIHDNVAKTSEGFQSAIKTVEILKKIETSVSEVATFNEQIAFANKEQLLGLQQISIALNQIDQASQSNAAASEQVSATSNELSLGSSQLDQLVENLNYIILGADLKNNSAHLKHSVLDVKKDNVVSIRSKKYSKSA